MIATTGQYFEEAPHDNVYWVDGVIASIPYDPSDIHIGDLDYDTTSQYLVYGKSRPHALDRIDKVRVRIWKEDRSPNVVYCMQPSSGKFWRCEDITVGTPTWTPLTAPSYAGSLNKLIVTSQWSSGVHETAGPRIYEVTGITSGSTLASTEIWGATENLAYIGGNYQRNGMQLFWSRELGCYIGLAHPADIQSFGPAFWGDAGDWNGSNITGGWNAYGTAYGLSKIIAPAGAGALIATAGPTIARASSTTPGSGAWDWSFHNWMGSYDVISDGANCIWADDYSAAGTPTLWHHDNLIIPISGLPGSAVDISPTVDGYKYVPDNGSLWQASRNLLDAGNVIYMLGKKRGSTTYKWFSKASWDQTPDDWSEAYDFGNWVLVGADVYANNTMKIVGKKQLASNNGGILYSEDGGASWADKTGDWDGDKQQAAQFSFAGGSAVVT
jgi:hypothetical protein